MTATASGNIATFSNGGNGIPVSEFECEIVAQQASGTPTPTDPLPITGFSQADITVTDNDQIANVYVVAFGQTIYGGRLIYANGEWSIEATHGYVDLGSLTWVVGTGGSARFVATTTPTPKALGEIISDCLQTATNTQLYNGSVDKAIAIHTNNAIWARDTDYPVASDFQTAMQGHYAVYELATPTIIPITSATRVKTISGDNNIYSNTGDCEVKYFTNKADSIAELVKAFVL